jgi:hypothetical protein
MYILNIPRTGTSRILLVLAAVLAFQHLTVQAQGNLTPAGPPAPTMKSLDQVEARTPVDATHTPGTGTVEFLISQPGSYYLTGNITGVTGENGIVINASDVTLDLNGFALIGVPTMSGIVATNAQNIAIRNGVVHNWGNNGIDLTFTTNCAVEKIRAYNNGENGISLGVNSIVANCVASGNTAGISGNFETTISDCAAYRNAIFGIFAGPGSTISKCSSQGNILDGFQANGSVTISGCTASGNQGDGFNVFGNAARISDCTAVTNHSVGILASDKATISGCVSTGNGGDGIQYGRDCYITGNNSCGNAGNGIHSLGQINRLDSNTASENGLNGIAWNNDLVIRNSCFLNTNGNYTPAVGTGNTGPITAASSSTNPFANF